MAAKSGGGDPSGNARLRLAISKAKELNMPQDNIKKAVMKGTGELPGTSYDERVYEGYGPSGIAVYIEVLTANKNRSVSDIRNIMTKHGGNLGEAGCVAWMFDKRGYILVDKKTADEDSVMTVALDAGALDMKNDPSEDNYEIIAEPEDFDKVKASIEKAGIRVSFSEVTMLPRSYIDVDEKTAERMGRLIEALEDNEDVQNQYANFNVPEEMTARASSQ